MDHTPQKFVDEFYEPSIGEIITIAYERNMGVGSSAKGETKGKIMKEFTNNDGEFIGFKMSIIASDHFENYEEDWLEIKSTHPKRELDVYLNGSSEQRTKINAIPGAVVLEEINKT